MKMRMPSALGACLCLFSASCALEAQQAKITLSGTVSAISGQVVTGAKVSARNVATGESVETRSDSAGKYRIANLAPGDYSVSVEATGFTSKSSNVTLTTVSTQMLDFVLSP